MAEEAKQNWLLVAIRNAVVSHVVGAVLAGAGSAALLTGVAAYLQKMPLAEASTFVILSAAGGAALVAYLRRVFLDANLAHKFFIWDVAVVHQLDQRGDFVLGYIPYIQLRNLADVPIDYTIEDINGHLERRVIQEQLPALLSGRAQATQDAWHALGVVELLPTIGTPTTLIGVVRVRIRYGNASRRDQLYDQRFLMHVLVDEFGNVLHTRAFHR